MVGRWLSICFVGAAGFFSQLKTIEVKASIKVNFFILILWGWFMCTNGNSVPGINGNYGHDYLCKVVFS